MSLEETLKELVRRQNMLERELRRSRVHDLVLPSSHYMGGHRQVGGAGFNTASNSFVDMPNSSKDVEKVWASTNILILVNGIGGFRSGGVSTKIEWRALAAGVASTAPPIFFFNQDFVHLFFGGHQSVSGVGKGIVNIKLQIRVVSGGTFNMDANDNLSWTAWEIDPAKST